MKINGRNLLIVCGVLVVVALLALAGPGRWWRSDPEPAAPVASGSQTSPETRPSPTADDFDRVVIRNIGTVPFEELFDLLRSASPATRTQWIKQLDEMPGGPKKTVALSSFYKTFVQLDPHAAAKSIAGLQEKDSQAIAVAAMLGAVPQSAMGEMAEMLVKLPTDMFWRGSPDYLGDVFYAWGEVDPSAAARFLEENPNVAVEQAGRLLINWSRLDPDAAKSWLEKQSESVQTEDAFASLITGWFQRDEANALAFTVAHSGDEKFESAINEITFRLLLRSPEEARTFLLVLPNEARNLAIRRIGMFSTVRPAEDIARWIITLPKESWREGLGTVLDDWESQNAAGFSAWLDQLPPETRDEMVITYCQSREPDRAIPLLVNMNDPTLRDQALRKYIAERLPPSRDKALLVINKIALSQAQKKKVIDLLPEE